MNENKKNQGIISFLLQSLNQEKIPYLVLRNYENLPEKTMEGSDIDFLIDKEDEEKYSAAFKNTILKCGGFVLFENRQSNCISYFIYKKEPFPISTWVDAFWEISAKGFIFANGRYLLENRIWHEKGFFISSPGGESAALFLKEIFSRGFIREKYLSKIPNLVKKDEENFIKTLEPYFSKKTIQEMLKICLDKNWEIVSQKKRGWWRGLVLNNFYRKPFSQIFQSLNFSFSQLKKFIAKKGIIIAFIGPDGVGKTTICQKLAESMKNVYFSKVYQYHSHLGFFPELGRIYRTLFRKSISEDSLSQENKIGFLRALLHLFYYGLENFLTWPRIFWLKTKRNLIIFDRYFYDFIAVNANSQFSFWLFWQIAKIIPRPDLIFIVKAQPEEIYKRKKELSLEEIKRRVFAFKNSKIAELAPAIFIDNQEPLGTVLNKTEEEILRVISKKYGGK